MSIEIYYFSGTGNSLFAARELQKRLPDSKLIPIVKLLKNDVVKTDSETAGFVFPIYLTTVPIPVREFLNKLDIEKTDYFFALMTMVGALPFANFHLAGTLKKKGKKLDAYFFQKMPENNPTSLVPAPGDKDWVNKIKAENVSIFDMELQKRLGLIQKIIINKENHKEKGANNPLYYLLAGLFSLLTKNMKTEISFFTDSTCNGCGMCEKVCPSKKIKITGQKPEWQKNIHCYYCYACFNFCPEQAILNKYYTEKKGRYFHPEITLNDIAGQK